MVRARRGRGAGRRNRHDAGYRMGNARRGGTAAARKPEGRLGRTAARPPAGDGRRRRALVVDVGGGTQEHAAALAQVARAHAVPARQRARALEALPQADAGPERTPAPGFSPLQVAVRRTARGAAQALAPDDAGRTPARDPAPADRPDADVDARLKAGHAPGTRIRRGSVGG